MSELKTKFYKCFETLENNFFGNFVGSINKRIIFQKYGLFFTTIFGLNTGRFSLYLHGPYNSSLADLGYEYANNISEYNEKNRSIEFSEEAINIINGIKQYLPLDDVSLLEVFSTYFYLKNKYTDLSNDDIYSKVYEIKKDLIIKDPSITKDKLESINESLKNLVNSDDEIILH